MTERLAAGPAETPDEDRAYILEELSALMRRYARDGSSMPRELQAQARAGRRPGVLVELTHDAATGAVLFDVVATQRGRPYGPTNVGALPRSAAMVAELALCIARDPELWSK